MSEVDTPVKPDEELLFQAWVEQKKVSGGGWELRFPVGKPTADIEAAENDAKAEAATFKNPNFRVRSFQIWPVPLRTETTYMDD